MVQVYSDLLEIVFTEAAELHKAPEQAQAPQGEPHDLILRRKHVQQAEKQVDRCLS